MKKFFGLVCILFFFNSCASVTSDIAYSVSKGIVDGVTTSTPSPDKDAILAKYGRPSYVTNTDDRIVIGGDIIWVYKNHPKCRTRVMGLFATSDCWIMWNKDYKFKYESGFLQEI